MIYFCPDRIIIDYKLLHKIQTASQTVFLNTFHGVKQYFK